MPALEEHGRPGIEELLINLRNLASPLSREGEVTNPITLVLPIDQAEELIPLEDDPANQDRRMHDEARTLRILLYDLLEAGNVKLILLAAIRSDSFQRLQHDAKLQDSPRETHDLSPLSLAAYRSIIVEPARVAQLAHYRKIGGLRGAIETVVKDCTGCSG